MTISSTTRIAGPYIGNGTATVFAFTFKVFAASDLDVVRLNTSTGVESTLVLSSDYSVTLNGDQNSNPGGSITLLAGALATGFTLTITSDIANLQPTDLTNQGGFYPEVITDALDRATIQIQQMSQSVGRSLKAPISDGTPDMELPSASQRANTFLAFDASGLPTVVTAGTSGSPTTITRQVFSGTGSQTVFTLASNPGALGNSAQIYIGGVYQQRSTYTISGTTLTFSAAPVAGTDNIEFVNFLTDNIGTTSADLVSYTPLGTGAVARSVSDKLHEIVNVADFGATGNGTSDDTSAIQNAVNYAASIGGAIVQFGDGIYAISDTLTIQGDNVVLRGVGTTMFAAPQMTSTRWSDYGGTIIKWIGASNPSKRMLLIGPPANGSRGCLGNGVQNMILDCDGLAGYGMEILSCRGGNFENIAIADATVVNTRIAPQSAASWTGVGSVGIRDTQHLVFKNVISRSWLDAAKSATGFLIDGDDVADCGYLHFDKIFYIHREGTGLLIKSSGAGFFGSVGGFRASLTSAVTASVASPTVITWNNHGLANGMGVIFTTSGTMPTGLATSTLYYVRNATTNTFQLSSDYENANPVNVTGGGSGTLTAYAGGLGTVIQGGTSTADDPTGHTFVFLEPSFGGLSITNGTLPPLRIEVFNYSIGNGSPVPSVSTNAHAIIGESFGRHTLSNYNGPAIQNYKRTDVGTITTTTTAIGQMWFVGKTSSGSTLPYALIDGGIYDNNPGSNTGYMRHWTVTSAGVPQVELAIRNGIVAGTAGTFQGIGTVNAVNGFYVGGNVIAESTGHLGLRSYTVATLPSAATAARMIYVSNGNANRRLAVSDGTNWRFPDGVIVF